MNKVYFIGAGPGDPELITLKGKRLLDDAQVVIYTGSLIPSGLLHGINAEIFDSAGMMLDEIITTIRRSVEEGKRVVRLHTGDPSIYSAIREQMEHLDKYGIPYEVVPGVSSAMAAAAALNMELTLPEVTQTVIITRHGGKTPVPEEERIRDMARHRGTMLIFLSISLIDEIVAELLCAYPEDTPVAVVEKVSWPDERIIRGTLTDISQKVKAAGIKKTAIIVAGEVLRDERLRAYSKLYDKDFSHGYRKRG
ncbi:MAG: precorrin-4 C(11)-methyltransferase [Nitrospirae bacterium]|nr:precorrin-4 C(11)-methyltransferase [Nitrospirota bacterium]